MKVIIIDLETTVQNHEGTKDNSPYNPKNRIVSAHWQIINDGEASEVFNRVFHHNEKAHPDSTEDLVEALETSDVLVAHNAKFDVSYLLEAGLPIPPTVWCTMVGEYILAKAQRKGLSLKETAQRYDVTRKKSELVDELFRSGIGFEAMPLDTVIEYAEADVISCAEIYQVQQSLLEDPHYDSLTPVFTLMNEMLLFLVEIERNGIRIDMDTLLEVEQDFLQEKADIEQRLKEIVRSVMGDTPINLNSGADMTKVVYSRVILNRDYHKRVFNIGTDHRGKPLPPARMTPQQFANTVRKSTRRVMKTVAYHCDSCKGTGKTYKRKKDGTPYKNASKCPMCDGNGYIYTDTGQVAGLKLIPEGPQDASINGFKTDKVTIKRLIAQAQKKENLEAIEFLSKLSRLNAVNTYLDSFVKNIKQWTRGDGVLHANFNQTTTRTGRLSSSNPNFQNQPKGGKFPIRKCVVSRFDGGEILEADFSGLEFRVAGELSRDPQIIDDILSGKDVHKQTASIISQKPVETISKEERQSAKAYTFAPLYGGMGASEPPHVQTYFKEYFNIYRGLARWHKTLMDGVLRNGIVQIPSGRQFFFPGAKRLRSGRITNATAVVNYPVQSFATADIVPLSCIRALQFFRENRLKSKLILTVHDSIVVDVFPGEKTDVVNGLTWAMRGVSEELKARFDYTAVLPLDIEMEAGSNWMETSAVTVPKELPKCLKQ
jgi:DNA polymerase I-like protein with 3'-5' exonuclease and polymerase domains